MTGQDLKHEGAARVLDNAGEWKDKAEEVIRYYAWSTLSSTSEDVRTILTDPPHPNAWGAAFVSASKKGIIRRVGFKVASRKSAHGRTIAIWEGV